MSQNGQDFGNCLIQQLRNQNPDISKVDKFNYLHLLLEGTAASAIQGLTLSESNYDSALELLREDSASPKNHICSHG